MDEEAKEYKYMVCTRSITYNHASYIENAMDGFTMQQTDFPFVCCIIDDASTDGEQEVIRKYLEKHFDLEDKTIVRNEETDDYTLCFARHKRNLQCYFVAVFLKYNHYSLKKDKKPYIEEWIDNAKYLAFCEGDDYWIYSKKLQEQVNALEQNQQCNIAYCKVQKIQKDGTVIKGETIPYNSDISEGITTLRDFCRIEFYEGHWCFQTSSFLLRSEFYKQTEERRAFYSQFPYGDMPTQLWCLLHGDGYFINKIGSCYRVLSGGYNSYVKEHPTFANRQENKLKNALLYLDNYTSRKYHDYIKRKILNIELGEERAQGGHFLAIYKPKYWSLLRLVSWKGHMTLIIKAISPSLYDYLFKKRKITVQ